MNRQEQHPKGRFLRWCEGRASVLCQPMNVLIVMIYVVAIAFFLYLFGYHFLSVFSAPTIFIAPIMGLGSFVAGSTFLGGGAVAFPAMTKLLMASPIEAKQFSLIIQCVGMTSASIFILKRMKAFPYRLMLIYLCATAFGLLLSLSWFQYWVQGSDVKLSFTVFILCFYIVFLISKGSDHPKKSLLIKKGDILVIFVAGILGGVISGLLGSGADLVLFCVLSLYFRLDFKTSTQISIIAMAGTSIIGFGWLSTLFEIAPQVVDWWVIAAPVVIIGAPLGAWFCVNVSNKALFLLVSCLVFVEVMSTLFLVEVEFSRLKYFAVIFVFSFLLFQLLLFLSKNRIKHSKI